MMLERVNYLLSVEVGLPRDEMVDRLSAIIYAAFHADLSQRGPGRPRSCGDPAPADRGQNR